MMNPLKTPPSFGGKKSLLKGMVRNTRPSKLSLKKASLKSVIGGKQPKGMKGLGAPAATGGSPFPLNSGLGNVPSGVTPAPDTIMTGRGSNLGTKGVF